MWNGKPISEWTLDEKNHFLTLLICAEWDLREKIDEFHWWHGHPNYYHDLSGFQTVKDFMESQMAETWEKYLVATEYRIIFENGDNPCAVELLNAWLSLDNLITYLLDNQEWALFEYTDYQTGEARQGKHPALTWAEGLKEEG